MTAPARQPQDRGTVQPFPFEHEDLRTPARQPHPLRCETCDYRYHADVGKCPYDYEDNYYLVKDEMRLPKGAWVFTSITGCASHSTHTSPPAPEPDDRDMVISMLGEEVRRLTELEMQADQRIKAAREQVLKLVWVEVQSCGVSKEVFEGITKNVLAESLRVQQQGGVSE